MMKAAGITLVAIALAGCDAAGPPTPAPSPSATGRDYVRAVAALSPRLRNGVFMKAINDAGLPCPSVTDSTLVPNANGKPQWRAHCSDDSYHVIDISPDGSATVISRIDQ